MFVEIGLNILLHCTTRHPMRSTVHDVSGLPCHQIIRFVVGPYNFAEPCPVTGFPFQCLMSDTEPSDICAGTCMHAIDYSGLGGGTYIVFVLVILHRWRPDAEADGLGRRWAQRKGLKRAARTHGFALVPVVLVPLVPFRLDVVGQVNQVAGLAFWQRYLCVITKRRTELDWRSDVDF